MLKHELGEFEPNAPNDAVILSDPGLALLSGIVKMEGLWRPEPCPLETIFNPDGFDGVVRTPSGAELGCHVTSYAIDVVDMDPEQVKDGKPIYTLSAYTVEPGDGTTALELSLRTVKRLSETEGVRHPDLRAKWFVARAARYLIEAGRTIDAITGNWAAPWAVPDMSDPYTQYMEAIQVYGDRPLTQQEITQAALGTWTGKVALDLGYGHPVLYEHDHENGQVVVDFWQNEVQARSAITRAHA